MHIVLGLHVAGSDVQINFLKILIYVHMYILHVKINMYSTVEMFRTSELIIIPW